MPATLPDPRIAATQRVVKQHDAPPLVRDVDGGAAEVVSVRRGRVYRHYVDAAGTTMLLSTSARASGWLIGRSILIFGAILFVLLFFLGPLVLGQNDVRILVLVGCAMLLMWGGWGVERRATARALRQFGDDDGWSPLITLGVLSADKPPLSLFSLPQLRAIERLVVEHGLVAVVRDGGDGDVEVVTASRRVLQRHLVDRAGTTDLLDSCPSARFLTLKRLARKRYGGRREDWFEINLQPDEGD